MLNLLIKLALVPYIIMGWLSLIFIFIVAVCLVIELVTKTMRK